MAMSLLMLFALQTAAAALAPVKLAGEVSFGETFEREFGPRHVFRLTPGSDPQTPGWTIEVRPKMETRQEVELSSLVTPPYRFFNHRYIEVSYGYSAAQIVGMSEREFY